jgi:hypothetical protein
VDDRLAPEVKSAANLGPAISLQMFAALAE